MWLDTSWMPGSELARAFVWQNKENNRYRNPAGTIGCGIYAEILKLRIPDK